MKGVLKVVSIAVVLPTKLGKHACKSLTDMMFFYKKMGYIATADICKAALECKVKAFAITHKVNMIDMPDGSKYRNHFVVMKLDFETARDGGMFIKEYSNIITN